MKPFAAVQPLFRRDDPNEEPCFAGSSFRLYADNYFLTAAHCVEGLCEDQIRVYNCTKNEYFETAHIHRHNEADLAVLEIAGDVPGVFEKFKLAPAQMYFGANTRCFGLQTDWLADMEQKKSPGRIIAGIIQCTFDHRDNKYKSHSFEYSQPIPKGMSGGPAFLTAQDDTVIGMAIGTIESGVVLSQIIEYEDDKLKESEKIKEITRYGVILRLAEYRDWLESILKPTT